MGPIDSKIGSNIGHDVLNNMYTNMSMETKDPQPLFILYRDTIRTFLHEKSGVLGAEGRVLGFFGVELTLIATLVTCTFNNFIGIDGAVIEGAFLTFAIIIGFYLLKEVRNLILLLNRNGINEMVDELGGRGSIIRSVDALQKVEQKVIGDGIK